MSPLVCADCMVPAGLNNLGLAVHWADNLVAVDWAYNYAAVVLAAVHWADNLVAVVPVAAD